MKKNSVRSSSRTTGMAVRVLQNPNSSYTNRVLAGSVLSNRKK